MDYHCQKPQLNTGSQVAINKERERQDGLSSYNEAQIEAITTTQGPVMVISCAGSGKTTVILERTARIVKQTGRPNRILVVTFSKAAATEMENRFREKYGAGGVRFATIHSICYSVLASTYGLKADAILKESEKRQFFRMMQETLIARGAEISDDFDEFYQEITSVISRVASRAESSGVSGNICDDAEKRKIYQWLLEEYTAYKKQNRKVDFDDMILLCYRCLKGNQQVLAYWQGIFDYVLIDEYQDTSALQAQIFFLLCEKHRNLCVVGDDDQAIYGFRGADSGIFLKFQQQYPDCRKIFMTVNYRSLPQIVRRSAAVIGNNRQRFTKEFQTAREGAGKIQIIRCGSDVKQVEAILKGVDEGLKKGLALKDMAVLYRVKREAASLVNRLLLEGIPFYTRELPQDIHKGMVYQGVMAYYRLANRIEVQSDLQRILNRPKRYLKQQLVRDCKLDRNQLYQACIRDAVSPREYDRINDTVNQLFLDLRNLKSLSPSSFLEYLDKDMGYVESLKDYAEYRKISPEEMERDYAALTAEARGFQDMAQWKAYVEESGGRGFVPDENGLYLSTFHGAKGLEWKKVWIISADEKVTPYFKEGEYQDLEEERRLFYVAMTRARDELQILTTEGKDRRKREMSRFVEEMMGRK